jgi:hypothetical protein
MRGEYRAIMSSAARPRKTNLEGLPEIMICFELEVSARMCYNFFRKVLRDAYTKNIS